MRRLAAIVALAAWIPGRVPVSGQQAPAPSPTPGSGQEKPAPERAFPPVVETVDVSVTSVEVVVTDSKGNRVPGLTAADFEVKQDGIAQKITNFFAVTGGKLLLEDGKVVDLGSKEEAAEVPREVKARYVFYIDNLNIQPMNRNRMFKRLKEFVAQVIGPNAEGMVVTFNRSLKVRRQFTSEVNDILGAIEQIELDSAGGTHRQGRVAGRARQDQRLEELVGGDGRRPDVRAIGPQRHGVHDRRHQGDDRQHGRPPGPQEPALHVRGPAGVGRLRALQRDPREVPGHRGHHGAVRLRPQHEVRQDRPVGQRQRRDDLHARRLGPDDERRDVRRLARATGSPRRRVPDAAEHAGPHQDDGGGDRRQGDRELERLEGGPGLDRRGLLELLLDRLPQLARASRTGRTGST